MISELAFIRSYNTFWKSLFPGGDDYVRLINSALGVKFDKPLAFNDIPNRRALINGISFSLFELNTLNEIKYNEIDKLTSDSSLLKKILLKEKKTLSNLRFGEKLSSKINDEELKVIKSISKRLIEQYSKKHQLKVRPKFKGCGIIFEANGDIVYSSTLSEVKAGDRNFNIQDIRQLYVYLALNHQSKEFNITQIELCNPRTGVIWREYIDVVSDNIAGSSTIEVYNEIINFISNDNRSL
jgi:hypothetical protein